MVDCYFKILAHLLLMLFVKVNKRLFHSCLCLSPKDLVSLAGVGGEFKPAQAGFNGSITHPYQ